MPCFRLLPVTVLALALAVPGAAQKPRPSYHHHEDAHPPVSIGGYLGAGAFTGAQPYMRRTGPLVEAGLYAEWAKHQWRPGIDMRFTGHANSLPSILADGSGGSGGSDKLIGPRLSYAYGILHPYVGGLFGAAHDQVTQAGGATTDADGVLKLGVVGLDIDADTHIQLRVFEYSAGRMSSPNNFLRQTFTSGIVFRFP